MEDRHQGGGKIRRLAPFFPGRKLSSLIRATAAYRPLDVALDLFLGSGMVVSVAVKLWRKVSGAGIMQKYVDLLTGDMRVRM